MTGKLDFQHAIVLTAMLTAAMPSMAQNYPSKPVRVLVPSSPGGASDIQARLFSSKLSEGLKQSFVVENRAGAGGRIAYSLVAHQAPKDGYTLVTCVTGMTTAQAIDEKPAYDAVKDFDPIVLMTKAPYAVVVHPKFPANSMKEFIAYARANPGKINFANSNLGAATQFAYAWLEDGAGIKMTLIQYKGVGPATQDLIAGRVDMLFANVISAGPHIKSGRIRALAVTTAERSSALPDLPTMQELGIKDYEVTPWHGWMGPKGMSRAALNVLNSELNKVLKLADVIKVISDDGGSAIGGSPQVFSKHIASEIERYTRLAKIGNIKGEED